MATLDPNGERGRSKPRKRQAWATALVSPQTVKVLLALMPRVINIVTACIELEKTFRN
jgi:hypothetical protein